MIRKERPNTTKSLLKEIDKQINNLDISGEPAELYLPLKYCLQNGGKRIRPLMTLLACDMFGGDVNQAMPAAIGIEVLHNFTLIHDDIMDQAPIRRGAPSIYKKWNINTAILSGDVMFAIAYRYMLKTPENHIKNVLDVFNETIIQVCEGQQYDMNFETINNISEAEYLNMIRLKTAVLPANSLKIGAIIADAPQIDLESLYKFGEFFGLAFQLKDDWLDAFGNEKDLGKKTGADIVANKKTWLYIKAFELADKRQTKILKEAFFNENDKLEDKTNIIKSIYTQLGINDLALSQMKQYYDEAFNYLYKINIPEKSKTNLQNLIMSLVERKS